MSRRKRTQRNLGEAISLEDALSIMVVIFVLFVLFLVPLVNFDKIKMAKIETDHFWKKSWDWAQLQKPDDLSAYRNALGFDETWVLNSVKQTNSNGNEIWIHATHPDSVLWLIRHLPQTQEFNAVKSTNFQTVLTFRHGQILWSAQEHEYIMINEKFDYGEAPQSQAFLKALHEWSLKSRGF